MTSSLRIRDVLLTVVRRPWPWILRYLGAFLPAMLVALLLLVPLRGWFRHPVAVEALETRSLGLLLEAVQQVAESTLSESPLWLLGLVAIPIIWLSLRGVWLWLDGGILTTYAMPQPPTVGVFLRACFRWLGTFLLVGLLVLVTVGVVVAGTVSVVLLLRSLWSPLAVVAGGTGGAVALGAIAFGELMRITAVVADDRHVLRALRRAWGVLYRRFLPVLVWGVGALIVYGLLSLAQRAGARAIPLSWWLATLIVQQTLQLAIAAVGLVRRAGIIRVVRQDL